MHEKSMYSFILNYKCRNLSEYEAICGLRFLCFKSIVKEGSKEYRKGVMTERKIAT